MISGSQATGRVIASSSGGDMLDEVIGGPLPDTSQGASSEFGVDIHSIPSHWKDEKHEPTGTDTAHLEINEAVIASRQVLRKDLVDGPVQFTVGANTGAQLLDNEMTRLEGCRLLSLDMDKWERSRAMMIQVETFWTPNLSKRPER